ncbi:hypothetical protein NFI96_017954, partial [Prochilodus magdalenae]
VRTGNSLSAAERQHLAGRKATVLKCLKQQNITCSEDEVPNIAVLGSGGGLRAMIGLLGSLSQLKEEGLLDCIMYLSGVSGSTWCMASLYNTPNWSTKLETVKDKIVQRLAEGRISWSDKHQKLVKYYSENENFSLTDVWSALTVSEMVKEINECKISQQKYTSDPYPIYTAIDKKSKKDKLNADVWFEITPDESGYSLCGAYADSSCLGSKFENGKKIKQQPEIDMLYLQGMCGSAIADMGEIFKSLKSLITETMAGQEMQIEKALLSLLELKLGVLRDEDPTTVHLKDLKNLLQDSVKAIRSSIQKTIRWIWGTTHNYLYKMEVKGINDSVLKSQTRDYVDAGLQLNSPYFSVLRKDRDIDLIISLDFSAGNPFETVAFAAKECKALNIPFPEVVPPPAKTVPQDFYVFKGSGNAPTVIHMPLFNAVNCGAGVGVDEKWSKEYSTTRMSYSHTEIRNLLEKASLNIKNNKNKFLKEIKNAIGQKKNTKLGCMASLYKESNWSTNLNTVQEEIIHRLAKNTVSWCDIIKKLHDYCSTRDDFSLTHVWAATVVSKMVKEIDEHKISEQRKTYTNDPYPIYTVIDKQRKYDRQLTDVWFEITPDESGYSLPGAFVDSSCLGSKFENGKKMKGEPEIDMLYLQGYIGVKNEPATKILRTTSQMPDVLNDLEALLKFVELNLLALTDGDTTKYLNEIKTMDELLKDKYCECQERPMKSARMMSEFEFKDYSLSICRSITNMFKAKCFKHEFWIAIVRSVEMILCWIWGTTHNFLYEMKVEDIDHCICENSMSEYEDAGVYLNSPYFSVLREERDIDLIISLDFSVENHFETVHKTAEVCQKLQIPFPKDDLPPEEKTKPKDFYVLKDDTKAPIVIHIPLFNDVNCKGEIEEWEKKYKTFQMSYTHEMITDLLEKAGSNIKNNKEKLLSEIKNAVERKKASKLGRSKASYETRGNNENFEEIVTVAQPPRMGIEPQSPTWDGSFLQDKVPNIAVLGSGGGLRAMIGLLGSLNQLKEEGLLDCIMYLSGVSGSTWCMASLYKERDWSTKLDIVTDIVERLANGYVSCQDKRSKLKKYLENPNFSLTDVWAALVVSDTVKEIDEHRITEQRGKYTNAPYPIYTVVDMRCKYAEWKKDFWFEITPDESGYSLYGAFVDSSCLGSEFENGTKIKDEPEMDMLYLQGLCGSALADKLTTVKEILKILLELVTEMQASNTSEGSDVENGCQMISALLHLNLCALTEEDPSAYCKTINDLMKDKHDEIGQMTFPVTLMTSEGVISRTELKDYTMRVCRSFSRWFGNQWFWDIVKCTEKVICWIWGTTYNYLYNMTVEEVNPGVLKSKTREYKDAGLLLNSPYLSVLRKERDIDLIISLDFSEDDPFKTVTDAAEKCKELHIPFPEVHISNLEEVQDFYVFKGSSSVPTVIHMPLFNAVNCKGLLKDEMPNIAVMGSGGGLRATVGLLGSLSQLKEQGLLDCIMYLSGVSGSTWCMASLYKEQDWSTKLETVKDDIIRRLAEGSVSLWKMGQKLVKYCSDKDIFSLTDVWAALIVSSMVKEIDEHRITEQRGNNAKNPYPIYTVIDDRLNADPWFEITPDESGYSLSGNVCQFFLFWKSFIRVTAGMCGSVIAHKEEMLRALKQLIPSMNLSLFDSQLFYLSTKGYQVQMDSKSDIPQDCQVLLTLMGLHVSALTKENPTFYLNTMDELLKGKTNAPANLTTSERPISEADLKTYTLRVYDSYPHLFRRSAPENKPKRSSPNAVGGNPEASLRESANTLTDIFTKWIWGTTYNYLHGMTGKDPDPSLFDSKTREYIDAGLLHNSPYVSVLRKERDIDLIISLDFSLGDPFQTVHKTAEVCQKLKIPFPKVDLPPEEKTKPKDFYVLKDDTKAPTVIHIPLFNDVNCKGEIEEWGKKYKTFQLSYTHEMITDLLEKAGSNIKNNKEKLLSEIKNAVERKKASKLGKI